MPKPVFPRRSTYRLNQRKAVIGPGSVMDTTTGPAGPNAGEVNVFARARGQATALSRHPSRAGLKLRKFSWEDGQ